MRCQKSSKLSKSQKKALFTFTLSTGGLTCELTVWHTVIHSVNRARFRGSVFGSLWHFSMICGRLSCSVIFFCHPRETYHHFVIGCFDLYGFVRAQPSVLFPRNGETISRRSTWSFVSSSTFTESLQWPMSRRGASARLKQAEKIVGGCLLGGWVTVLVKGLKIGTFFLIFFPNSLEEDDRVLVLV